MRRYGLRKYLNLVRLAAGDFGHRNKNIRYREKHTASVVLSCCTLRHFSGENLFMVDQPLLRNRPVSY